MEVHVAGAQDMAKEAERFIAELSPSEHGATILALSGDLGAGKTTFTQEVAKALGVMETVASPTFVIEKIYSLSHQKWNTLIHIDAYRIEEESELEHLGWRHMISDPNNIIVIEWPERVPDLIPESANKISIEIGEGSERTIHYGN